MINNPLQPINIGNAQPWSKNTARIRSNTGHLRTVFYRNPGRCFTIVCNEYTAKLRLKIRLSVIVDPGSRWLSTYYVIRKQGG
jgi:hypothetical protein